MTEENVITPVSPAGEIPQNNEGTVQKEKDEHKDTIFKTSYWYGRTLIQMFVNYNYGGYGSFGFLIKKANTTLIYNLRKDEKLKFAKAVIAQLTPEERAQLGI